MTYHHQDRENLPQPPKSAPPNQQPLCPPACRGISAVFPRHRRPRPVAAFAWCPWRSCELQSAANSNAPAAWRDWRRGARHRWQPSRPNIVPDYPWPILPRTEAPSSNKTRKGRSKTGSDCFNRAERQSTLLTGLTIDSIWTVKGRTARGVLCHSGTVVNNPKIYLPQLHSKHAAL